MINNEDDPNEEDMGCPFHVPDGFRISQEPPDENALGMERDNSQADALVDRFIMYKWLHVIDIPATWYAVASYALAITCWFGQIVAT